jgi:hypothetical protein
MDGWMMERRNGMGQIGLSEMGNGKGIKWVLLLLLPTYYHHVLFTTLLFHHFTDIPFGGGWPAATKT